jgi:hypothetical protein
MNLGSLSVVLLINYIIYSKSVVDNIDSSIILPTNNILFLLGNIFKISFLICFYKLLLGTPNTIDLNFNLSTIKILNNALPRPHGQIIFPLSFIV